MVISEYGKNTGDLLSLSVESSDLQGMQSEFESSGQEELPVYVHPFAELYLREQRATAVRANLINTLKGQGFKGGLELKSTYMVSLQGYLEGLQTKFAENLDSVLVIAEEKERLEHTLSLIRGLGFKGNLLFYKTMRENPRPIDVNDSQGWTFLTLKLMMLGIGKVSIGGQYHKNPDRIPKNLQVFTLENMIEAKRHGGCVGALTNNILYGLQNLNLSGNESVSISQHVYDEY